MAISDDELSVLVRITGKFENSGDPYVGVAGNFDGQGISCGVLQWNIGQASLQPLVRSVGKAVVLAKMPTLGGEMWEACNAPLKKAMAIVLGWQTANNLRPTPKAELRALMGSKDMRLEQDKRIRSVAAAAETLADRWADDRGAVGRVIQELVWFFDIVTQNGSMKGLTYADVVNFKKAAGPGKADDLVCDWLAATTKKYAGYKDCHKNAALWRDTTKDLSLDLLVLGYLRSQKSILTWRGDVLNRKGTLAMKGGYVHKTLFDLTKIL